MYRPDDELRALDLALQRFARERDPHLAEPALAAIGLASRQVGDGHVCLDLGDPRALGDGPLGRALQALGARAIGEALRASSLVAAAPAEAGAPAWFVLDGERLYLRRYWQRERDVIAALSRRLEAGWGDPAPIAAALDGLFAPGGDAIDWQRIACAVAAGSRFAVITGGPGTGKTTTVVRLLALRQRQARAEGLSPLRIRLAAPTGKAAARLGVTIGSQLAELTLDDALRASIPSEVVTVHRLLGRRPDSRRPAHDAGQPLPLDLLVVDEASMIDLEMMADLLAALPDTAQLVLLGDRDQLASVEAGAVFGDLCRRAARVERPAAAVDWLAAATGTRLPVSDSAGSRLDPHIVMLRDSHRFRADSGIGRLATEVNAGRAGALAELFADHRDSLCHREKPEQAIAIAVDGYRDYLQALAATRPDPDAAPAAWLDWAARVLAAHGRFQLLAATRRGPSGVEALNEQIAAALAAAGLLSAGGDWYEGRPVMLTRNDFALGLMNGDVGVTLALPAGDRTALRVVFPSWQDGAASIRIVSPARLADVETVFAMTVHKSQGSEYAHAALVLPDVDSPVLSRELLYTAITRARQRFSLIGPLAIAAIASARPTRRASGLAEAWAATDTVGARG